jgi:hypothetical protein
MNNKGFLDSIKAAYSKRFEDSFSILSQDEQKLVSKKCNLWHGFSAHPSLRFRNWSGHVPAKYRDSNPKYFRVSLSIRILVIEEDGKPILEYVVHFHQPRSCLEPDHLCLNACADRRRHCVCDYS